MSFIRSLDDKKPDLNLMVKGKEAYQFIKNKYL